MWIGFGDSGTRKNVSQFPFVSNFRALSLRLALYVTYRTRLLLFVALILAFLGIFLISSDSIYSRCFFAISWDKDDMLISTDSMLI
jgi:hypothetical protein